METVFFPYATYIYQGKVAWNPLDTTKQAQVPTRVYIYASVLHLDQAFSSSVTVKCNH